MDKPDIQFEPVQQKANSAWQVRITLPHGVEQYIGFFKTEAEARTWIDEDSAVRLMKEGLGIF